MKLIRITTVPLSLKLLITGQCSFMKENGMDVIMISADGKERKEVIEYENVPHFIVPMTRQITPLQDLICLWKLYQFFKKEKPQIVHSHTPKAGLLSMIAAYFANVPIRLHTVAGLPLMTTTGLKKIILEWCEKITYRYATEVLPNSKSLFQFITENKFCVENKLHLIGKGSSNGIDLKRFSKNSLNEDKLTAIKQQIQYDAANFYLLSIGRIVYDKGIEELVSAFLNLQKEQKNLRLIIVGDFENDLDAVSETTKKIIENEASIIHISWTNDVEYYLAIANLLVHTSHREGFPNVLLQAAAMECPIVCSNIFGNIDIVENEKTGIYFEVKNVVQLTEKINYSIHHSPEMQAMAMVLKNEVEQFYDRNFIQQEIFNHYNQLLKENNLL